MARNKITQRMSYRVVQDLADMQSFQRESFGNQDAKKVFIDITIDGSGSNGKIIIGSDLAGNIINTSVYLQARPKGGIDIFNGSGTMIASLDLAGNLKTLGTIIQSTTP